MIPPCWLFGLKYSSTGVYRLLGEARSPYKNGHPWSTHQGIFLRASIIKVLALPVGPHLILGSPRDSVRLAGRSMGSYGVTALPWVPVHMKIYVDCPRVESVFPQVLRRPCTQALLAFKDKCSGASPSQCQNPRA